MISSSINVASSNAAMAALQSGLHALHPGLQTIHDLPHNALEHRVASWINLQGLQFNILRP